MANRNRKILSGIASFLCLPAFFILALAGCAVNPVTGEQELMFVSEAQEIEMGREFYPSAIWASEGGGGEFNDPALKAYLKDIIVSIHGVSHRPNLPVDFAIQNSSIPNAWAIPGHVVITRGLLAGLGSEAEFAFVMGHEMGHVSARHSARQMTRGMLQGIGLAAAGVALSGKDYSDMALMAGAVGSTLVMLKYSRDDELQADGLGMLYMNRLGYDTQNAIKAHESLEKTVNVYIKDSGGKGSREGGFLAELLSTHPRTSVRIDELNKMKHDMEKPSRAKGDGTEAKRYSGALKGLKEKHGIYTEYYDKALSAYNDKKLKEADDLVSKAIAQDMGEPAFFTLKGLIAMERKGPSEARKYFDTALDLDENYEPALRGRGAVDYAQKDYGDAIKGLKRAVAIFPEDAPAHYFLGMSYYKSGDCRHAVPHLSGFANNYPKHPEVHGILGTCYEEAGYYKEAYGEYAAQLNVSPYGEISRYARSRMAALKPYVEEPKGKKKK